MEGPHAPALLDGGSRARIETKVVLALRRPPNAPVVRAQDLLSVDYRAGWGARQHVLGHAVALGPGPATRSRCWPINTIMSCRSRTGGSNAYVLTAKCTYAQRSATKSIQRRHPGSLMPSCDSRRALMADSVTNGHSLRSTKLRPAQRSDNAVTPESVNCSQPSRYT
jgi:hypothetical protein